MDIKRILTKRRNVIMNNKIGCLGQLLSIFSPKLRQKAQGYEKWPYHKRKSLMSEAEYSFYRVLLEAIDLKEYLLFTKVSQSDLVYVKEKDNSRRMTFFNKISRKHIDFVVCDKLTAEPLIAIELDDSSHNRQDRIHRDQEVDKIFKDASFPLVRFKAKRGYSIDEVRNKLEEYLEIDGVVVNEVEVSDGEEAVVKADVNDENGKSVAENESDSAPTCPKCNAPMAKRIAKSGDNKGKEFYGCTKFPKCRTIIKITDTV